MVHRVYSRYVISYHFRIDRILFGVIHVISTNLLGLVGS